MVRLIAGWMVRLIARRINGSVGSLDRWMIRLIDERMTDWIVSRMYAYIAD